MNGVYTEKSKTKQMVITTKQGWAIQVVRNLA